MTHDPHLPPASPATEPHLRLQALEPGHTLTGAEQQDLAAELAERLRALRSLGVSTAPNDEFDALATRMANATGFLYGMVNLVLDKQVFVGLHNPPLGGEDPIVGRTMDREHGWCPEVVERKTALPLPNVHASSRFSGNYVVDAINIQSYFGAPLIHPDTGVVLGTVCVVDRTPRELDPADQATVDEANRILGIVKGIRDEVLSLILARRQDGSALPGPLPDEQPQTISAHRTDSSVS